MCDFNEKTDSEYSLVYGCNNEIYYKLLDCNDPNNM